MHNKHATPFPHIKYKIACLAALSDEFVSSLFEEGHYVTILHNKTKNPTDYM
jgi:hypothetical protein